MRPPLTGGSGDPRLDNQRGQGFQHRYGGQPYGGGPNDSYYGNRGHNGAFPGEYRGAPGGGIQARRPLGNNDAVLPRRGPDARNGGADISGISGHQRSFYDNREQRDRERERQTATMNNSTLNRSNYQGGGRREDQNFRDDRRRLQRGQRVLPTRRSKSAQQRAATERSGSRRRRNRSGKRFTSKERREKGSSERDKINGNANKNAKNSKQSSSKSDQGSEEQKAASRQAERRQPRGGSLRRDRSPSLRRIEKRPQDPSPKRDNVYFVRNMKFNKMVYQVKEMLHSKHEEVEVRGLGNYGIFDAIRLAGVSTIFLISFKSLDIGPDQARLCKRH